MGQVNVNSGEPSGSSGSGFILGIIVAILVVAALLYFFVFNGDGGTDDPDDGDGGADTTESMEPEVDPSGWRLVELV